MNNIVDVSRQVRMICEYREYLQHMYGRIVTHTEAEIMWGKSYAEKYRLLHPYIIDRINKADKHERKKSKTDS